MFGTHQSSAPARGRSILALSTLALLALCCVPVLAYGSSAGFQYEDAPQTATGKPPSESNLGGGSPSTSGVGPSADKSNLSGGGGSTGGKAADAGEGSSKSGGATNTGDTAGQQGSQAQDDKNALGVGEPTSSSEPGSDGGGSSPLVPILIAILVLAGASVAYVVIKRRRGEDSGSPDSSGSPVSPEAN